MFLKCIALVSTVLFFGWVKAGNTYHGRNLLSHVKFDNGHDIINISNDKLPHDFPCPLSEVIFPCVCSHEEVNGEGRLYLDCTNVASEQELSEVFEQDFPVTEFYEFRMSYSTTITKLDTDFGDVSFKIILLYMGIFPNLTTITDNFINQTSETLEFIHLFNTEIRSFPFSVIPSCVRLESLYIYRSQISHIPDIISDSLTTFAVISSPLTDITPGTFDQVPSLAYLHLDDNQIKTLRTGTIPITENTRFFRISSNGLETIEPGAFYLTGTPAENYIEMSIIHNQLKTLDEDVFSDLMPFIWSLYIYENPLDCGCDLAWIAPNPEYFPKILRYNPTCADGSLVEDIDAEILQIYC